VRIVANERTIPRLHLLGTLVIVITLTLALGAFFLWRSGAEQQASLQRIAASTSAQQEARLLSEMQSAASYIEFTRKRTQDVLRRSIRDQVDTAMQIAQSIYQREIKSKPVEEVKRSIIEALRKVRFYEGRGYYFIDDLNGQFILLPTAPQLEGKTNLDNRDDKGHFIMRGLIEAAQRPDGGGYSSYRWYTPDNPKVMDDKLAYVRLFAPFKWLIGTGDYSYKWEQLQKLEAIERLRSQRFGKSGYIGILDADGTLLLAPANPNREGHNYLDLDNVQRDALEQIRSIATLGGGQVHYQWTAPDLDKLIAKTAMVRRIDPWGWTLIATIEDDELQSALNQELSYLADSANAHWTQLIVAMLIALTSGLAASYAFAQWSGTLYAQFHAETAEKNRVIEESEALFRAVFDNAAVGIAQVSPQGTFLQINQYFCDMLGYTRSEILGQAFSFQHVTLADDLSADTQHMARMLGGELHHYRVEKRYVHKSGRLVWASLSAHLLRDTSGTPLYFITAVLDITDKKRAEERLQLAASVFSHAREAIMITDPVGNIMEVNDAFLRITGYAREEAVGQTPRLLKSGRQSAAYYAAMWRDLTQHGHWQGEVWNRRKNGQVYAELQTISAVNDAKGKLSYFVALFTDITPLMEHNKQLEHIAHYDALTELPNRVLLADRLQQALAQCQRRSQFVAVAYLDLDGFKAINDSYGHDVGDQLLIALAGRMKSALRDGDTLARIGGDEFAAVLVDLASVNECEPVLRRLLQVASEKVLVGDKLLQVSASIGVTVYPLDGSDPDLLMRHADQAMYQAKQSGKNRFQLFDLEHDVAMQGQQELMAQIGKGLERCEFVLYYQPKINMRTQQVMGAEALIRWQHPQRGLLAPLEFLPAVDESPLSVAIGEWVIDTALAQMDLWHRAGFEIPVSVNIGAYQLQQSDFTQRLQGLLRAHPEVPPSQLQLEVLETNALQDITMTGKVMNQCRDIGVGFALDDFGTGYSSLTYLKHLPAEMLKIDQSFVRDMLEDSSDLAIVQSVIGLARAFARSVLAEGVETQAHGVRLLTMGCELAQGYGIGHPMTAPAFDLWLKQWQAQPTWKA
jgi:diguanylate cyclase (GGDEF)-like protein/PAS domain S-box-containing protein